MLQTQIHQSDKPSLKESATFASTLDSSTASVLPPKFTHHTDPIISVSNHGIPESVIDSTIKSAKSFFSLPLAIKEEVRI